MGLKIISPNTVYLGSATIPSGGAKQVTLLSVTTAPSGTFEKGNKYYNATTKKVYTATDDNTWNNADESNPQFGTIYVYNNNYYQWDGDNLVETDLEKYQLVANKTDDYTETSTTKYPSSKALNDGLMSKQDLNLSFTNVSASSWIADSTYTDYGYKCELSCSGVTSSMYAMVNFAPTEADSGNYATVCQTGSNTVTIYSKVNDTITIPSIVVMGA